MIKIEKKYQLGPQTTLRIPARADYFTVAHDKAELLEAISFAKKNNLAILILGGGSNLLFLKNFAGLVIKNEIKGIRTVSQTAKHALVEALSGESWSRFVAYNVDHGFYGLENLFLIYGTVGAAPVQNIGAYGVELKDNFHHLVAIDLKTGRERTFSAAECHFGYRDSIFKKRLRGRYFIYSVTVKLALKPDFKLDYGSIREKLAEKGLKELTARAVVRVIEEIRNSKLPNPALLPNAGSFFKNPEVSVSVFRQIQKQYPAVPSFPGQGRKVKIPAGWLIEQAGFKGKRFGPVRMYERQALILVNEGGASARQVLNLINKVKDGVKKKFGLDLQAEVNII